MLAAIRKPMDALRRALPFLPGPERFRIKILDRYIFVEILQPFLVVILFFTTLFISITLKDVIGDLLGKNINPLKILEFVVYLLGEKLSMTIPLACLFAGILAAGRLSGDSEITAMRSAGISFPRMYAVFIVFGLLAASLVTLVNFWLGPIAAQRREDFQHWLQAYHSLSLVRAGDFLGRADFDGVSKTGQDIYAEYREEDVLHQVQIREWYNDLDEKSTERIMVRDVTIPIGDGFITRIMHAQTGELLTRRMESGVEEKFIRLKNGYIIELDPKQERYQVTNFRDGSMDYVIPPPVKALGRLNVKPDNYTFEQLFGMLNKMNETGLEIDTAAIMQNTGGMNIQLGDGVSATELYKLPPLPEMRRMREEFEVWITLNAGKVGQPDGPTAEDYQQKVQMALLFQGFLEDAEKTRRRFQVEIQKRIAAPAACLLFFFVSFPLGLVVKRSGKGAGFLLALVFFIVYYIFYFWGVNEAGQGRLPPVVGAWLPNLVIGGVGLYIMSTRTDDFAPFGFLTRPLRSWWKRFVAPRLDPIIDRLENGYKQSGLYRFLSRTERGLKTWRKNQARRDG